MGVFKLIKVSFFLAISIFLIHFWLTNKSYLFTEEGISAIAKKFSVAGNKNEKELQKIFDNVHAELEKQYSGHILPKRELQWITMSAGGWVGSVCVMHATLTEYVAFFGSAVDTVGASGRYWANISDTVLTGEFHQWPEATHKVNIYKPGDFVKHAWGETTVVNFKGGLWMLEYGRGFLPSTFVFAFADMVFSTQDFVSVYYFIRIYVRGFLWEFFADALI